MAVKEQGWIWLFICFALYIVGLRPPLPLQPLGYGKPSPFKNSYTREIVQALFLLNWGLLLKQLAPWGSKFFPVRINPLSKSTVSTIKVKSKINIWLHKKGINNCKMS